MGSSARQKSLSAGLGFLFCFALFPAVACAQAVAPAKEGSPFDWLRHDATPTNRPGGSTFYPPVESLNDQKKRQQIERAADEAPMAPMVVEAPLAEASPTVEREAPVSVVVEAPVESAAPASAPSPIARPAPNAGSHPAAKAKPAPPMEEIVVINNRSVTLNELKLVSLKEGRKSFVVKPSLKAGQTLTVEIPKEWGCLFLVWTQFSEEPSEQYDGVDLCSDRKINLIN